MLTEIKTKVKVTYINNVKLFMSNPRLLSCILDLFMELRDHNRKDKEALQIFQHKVNAINFTINAKHKWRTNTSYLSLTNENQTEVKKYQH
jgi:hypothetical protein